MMKKYESVHLIQLSPLLSHFPTGSQSYFSINSCLVLLLPLIILWHRPFMRHSFVIQEHCASSISAINGQHLLKMRHCHLWLLHAIKSKPTYSEPNGAFKVTEVFKQWFYQFHPHRPQASFHARTGELNPGLLNPSPLLYPLHHTWYPWGTVKREAFLSLAHSFCGQKGGNSVCERETKAFKNC